MGGEGFPLHSQGLITQCLHLDASPEPWHESFPSHISLLVSRSVYMLGSSHRASVLGSGDVGPTGQKGPCLHMMAALRQYFLFTEVFFVAQGSHLLKLMLRLCYNSQRTGKQGSLSNFSRTRGRK